MKPILIKAWMLWVSALLLVAGPAAAAEFAVSVKNLTNGIYFNTRRTHHRYLSLVAMLLPTNDGFVGLDGLDQRFSRPSIAA